MRTPTVYVINEPLKKDDATGEYVPFLPMESAANFGRVVELTPKGNPGSNLGPAMRAIRAGLEDWEDGDFIVLVGDQALLAYAASVVGVAIAAAAGPDGEDRPTLRFLKWERRANAYAPLTLREPMATSARESA